MRLAKLEDWRALAFAEGSRPRWHTALRWAKAGKIPGAVHIHGAWHVDLDAYEQAVANQTAAGEKTTEAGGAGSALAKRLEGMG